MINTKSCCALIDTGSEFTLVRRSVIEELGLPLLHSKTIPPLLGITGTSLTILGTATLTVAVGISETIQHLAAVVPDEYLQTDILLGVDLLGRFPMHWDHSGQTLRWADITYTIRHVTLTNKRVRFARRIQAKLPNLRAPEQNFIRVSQRIVVGPHETAVLPVTVSEECGSLLEIHPQNKAVQQEFPICTRVTEASEVFIPFRNLSRGKLILKPGTFLATYEKLETQQISELPSPVQKLSNAMLPDFDRPTSRGTREEKLQSLIDSCDWSHLNDGQKEQLSNVFKEHNSVFILGEHELGTMNVPPAHIPVADPTPTRSPLYRTPEKAKPLLEQMLRDMLQRDIIEPSTAAWLSPIVLVAKPGGAKRMCLDYRNVNTKLQADIQPLPRLDELVELTSGHQYYATLDLKDAYYQIKLDEESKDLTTFSDGVALYRFKRLPFGLSCSPAIFTRQMSLVLAPLAKEGWVRNYLDDVLMWAPSFEVLLTRLSALLGHLAHMGLKLNLSKCRFAHKQVKFLGHLISEQGCKPDPENVEAVISMKAPTHVKEVRRFIGMAGFYRKSIPNFAKIAAPLTNLTRKDQPFDWTPECDEAFQQLKTLLVSAPVLVKANMSRKFQLHTDASKTHVGAALMQQQGDGTVRPVGYFSRKLKPAETRYSTTDREALAVILACRHFHHYLWGVRFQLYTDHEPLVAAFKKKTKSARMNRWCIEMREYRYDVLYQPGPRNVVPDQLSRPVQLVRWEPEEKWLGKTQAEMREIQCKEKRWKDLIDFLEGGTVPKHRYPRATLNQFVVDQGVLYFVIEKADDSLHYLLVVPTELKQAALHLAHDQESAHLGRFKTIRKAETYFYWPNLREDVGKHVKECLSCQQTKGTRGLQQPWQELPAVSHPLERVSVDLTDMVAGMNGYRYILTVTDHFSRYVKFYRLRTKTSNEVSKRFQDYLYDFGAPQYLLLDNGGEFTSQQFRDLCRTYHIKLGYTTPYHPRGNSVTERMHQTLKTVLANLCRGHPLRWPNYIGECQRVLNSAIHITIGEQPHFAFFGRYAQRNIGVNLPEIVNEERKEAVAVAQEVLKETAQSMARKFRDVANRKRKNEKVECGDLVWVRNETPLPGASVKLQPRWVGPYRVTEVIRDGGAYKLRNPLTGTELQRAAEKVKPYYGREEWLTELTSTPVQDDFFVESLPPRARNPTRRYIEES